MGYGGVGMGGGLYSSRLGFIGSISISILQLWEFRPGPAFYFHKKLLYIGGGCLLGRQPILPDPVRIGRGCTASIILVRVQSLAGPGLFWQMYHGVICQEGLCSICLYCVHSEIAAFGALSGEV